MSEKIIVNNKKAYFNFFIDETFECGIELKGSEVKSIRQGKINVQDAYAMIIDGEMILKNLHISPYEKSSVFAVDPDRDRRLLLHKREIIKLKKKVEQRGFSLVPTKIYFKDSYVKVEIGLARGKKLYDKRESIQEKEQKRKIERVIKSSI